MPTYEVLKKDYVFETLGKGNEVIICDFSSLEMKNCESLRVGQIQTLLGKDSTVCYKVIPAPVEE